MKSSINVRVSLYTLITILYFSYVPAQNQGYKVLNVRLVGVNCKANIGNISRVQRYYETAGFRINLYSQESIRYDSLMIPRLEDSKLPNRLMQNLINSYQTKVPKKQFNQLTIFCLPKVANSSPWQGFDRFGYAFYATSLNDDNRILGSIAQSLGINHVPDSATFLKDSIAINSLKLITPNYTHDVSQFTDFDKTGLSAFFIWEEDENGVIPYDPNNPLLSIKRGKRENYGYKYLNPGNWFFKPFTSIQETLICPAHVVVAFITFFGLFIFFRLIKRLTLNRNWSIKLSGVVVKLLALLFSIFVVGLSTLLIDEYYVNHYVLETKIREIDKQVSSSSLLSKIEDELLFQKDTISNLSSQIFRKKKAGWYIQRNLPVLIFQLNSKNELRFKESTESLTYLGDTLIDEVNTHFIKIEKLGNNDELISERIFDYAGKEQVSTSFQKEKIGKRIVLFINGYRAPFLNTEEFSRSVMLKQILANKIEINTTENKIYSADLFKYWNQWDRFDDRFIAKLQAHEVYYADGHHPIKTSNYGLTKNPFNLSIINNIGNLSYFYFAAAHFPSTCKDLSKHTCRYVNIPNLGVKNTWELLPSITNHIGFNQRRESGKISGKNLLQLINAENRVGSSKDTLYIVCHSMGFAYAQGIIESLRGKINFGGYYIFCPENPSAGRVNKLEWKEVWQYGSNENIEECLQDGIAPQSSVKGLEQNRVFFPKESYSNLGFSGSHFIGNFIWIFDLPKSQVGSITSH